jgi:hypothetical protein
MPGIDFSRLRAEITMADVLELLGFAPTDRRGDQWYGACPLHASTAKHPRVFSVNVRLGCYYCHKCHSQGDQFQLWSHATHTPIRPATIDLCQQLGCQVPWIARW